MSFPRTSDVSRHLARKQRPQPKLGAKPLIITDSTDEYLEAVAERAPAAVVVNGHIASANYTVVAQNRDEMMVPENSPSVSMWPYLLNSAQPQRLNHISVYTDRGTSRDQSRLLYLNADALSVWREMGMRVTIIGESHRPPRTAMLSFGMPFSE